MCLLNTMLLAIYLSLQYDKLEKKHNSHQINLIFFFKS